MISNQRILAAVLILGGLGAASCRAQPPAPPPPPPPGPPGAAQLPPPPPGRGPRAPAPGIDGSRTTVTGVVRNFNYGPGGLDGLILDRGTVVHFPPEYGSRVSFLAPIGSAITASGWSHIGPAGDTLFDADAITNQRGRASVSIAGGPPPPPPGPPGPPPPPGRGPAAYAPPPPPPPRGPVGAPPPPAEASAAFLPPGPPAPVWGDPAAQTSVVSGTVRSFNYAPDGQVNGLILSDGSAVYFPAELRNQVTNTVPINVRVTVTGWARTGPTGNRLIDAQTVRNRRTGASVSVGSPPPPVP